MGECLLHFATEEQKQCYLVPLDNKLPFTKEAAVAKLYAAETAAEVTTKAVQIHGGYGYMRESRVQLQWRAAKLTEIYEGTSEIQRFIIARQLLQD